MVVTVTGQLNKGNFSLVKIQILNGLLVEDIIQLLAVYEDGSTTLEREIKGSSEFINSIFDIRTIDTLTNP